MKKNTLVFMLVVSIILNIILLFAVKGATNKLGYCREDAQYGYKVYVECKEKCCTPEKKKTLIGYR